MQKRQNENFLALGELFSWKILSHRNSYRWCLWGDALNVAHFNIKTNSESFTIANVNGIIIRQLFFQWHNKFSFFCCSTRHAFKNNLKVGLNIYQTFTFKGQKLDKSIEREISLLLEFYWQKINLEIIH